MAEALSRGDVVVVEIPAGSRNKYEVDHATGEIFLDRRLFTATRYPSDYGFFPDTLADDGDPLDALVLLSEPTFPGCRIRVRPIGIFWMEDEKGDDAKVLCVPLNDPTFGALESIDALDAALRAEIEHFFTIYKALEPGKQSTTRGWGGVEEARSTIDQSRRAFDAVTPSH
jgi:inorganic pyrophosphatase